jgi:hypothetical protein
MIMTRWRWIHDGYKAREDNDDTAKGNWAAAGGKI